MSRLRHKKGMKFAMPSDMDTDADGMKKGGKVCRARGGGVEMDDAGMPPRARMDRPGRKRGGRAGADLAPLSSASSKNPLC